MHTYNPLKSLTINKKKYCLTSFAAIDPKILVMIDDYAIYDKQVFFRARHAGYISDKLRKSKFCIW